MGLLSVRHLVSHLLVPTSLKTQRAAACVISKAELSQSAQWVCVLNPTLTKAKQSLTETLDEGSQSPRE